MTRYADGERIGRRSLRWDAVYCVVLGAAVLVAAPWVGSGVALPVPVIAGVGAAVIVWAGLVVGLLRRLPLRMALRIVMVANVVAAVAVASVSVAAATGFAILVVLAVAVEVALFAASQAAALRLLRLAPAGVASR